MIKKSGSIVLETYESKILKNNPLGDPFIRDFPVYLPPSYFESEKGFPVAYLLSGFTGTGLMNLNMNFLSENIYQRLNRLIGSGKVKEMIVVMPDCMTKYGGSQFINSTATGRYEDYVTSELVEYIDTKYRTLRNPNYRAVCGKSSGGYGAVILAMKNPDIFGLMCSTAGDMYFEYCYQPDFPKFAINIGHYGKGDYAIAKFIKQEINFNQPKPKHFFDLVNNIAMASCYSPNPNGFNTKGYNFDMPINLSTGELDKKVFDKWLKHDPVKLVDKYYKNLKKLNLIYLDAGIYDEFNLQIGARIFCNELKKKKVNFIHEEFKDGHRNIQYRYDRTFEIISKHLN